MLCVCTKMASFSSPSSKRSPVQFFNALMIPVIFSAVFRIGLPYKFMIAKSNDLLAANTSLTIPGFLFAFWRCCFFFCFFGRG